MCARAVKEQRATTHTPGWICSKGRGSKREEEVKKTLMGWRMENDRSREQGGAKQASWGRECVTVRLSQWGRAGHETKKTCLEDRDGFRLILLLESEAVERVFFRRFQPLFPHSLFWSCFFVPFPSFFLFRWHFFALDNPRQPGPRRGG